MQKLMPAPLPLTAIALAAFLFISGTNQNSQELSNVQPPAAVLNASQTLPARTPLLLALGLPAPQFQKATAPHLLAKD